MLGLSCVLGWGAVQVAPGAQPLQAGYQAAYQGQMSGMAYPGQPSQLGAAAPMATQQPLGGQFYGQYYG